MAKLYIDTNIFLDALRRRRNNAGKDLSGPALRLFLKIEKGIHEAIVSMLTLEQLYRLEPKKAKLLIQKISYNTKFIRYDDSDKVKANLLLDKFKGQLNEDELKQLFEDALQVVLAEKGKSESIVSRNLPDFEKLGKKAVLPERIN